MATGAEDRATLLTTLDAFILPGSADPVPLVQAKAPSSKRGKQSCPDEVSASQALTVASASSSAKRSRKNQKATPALTPEATSQLSAGPEAQTPQACASKGREITRSGKKYRQAKENTSSVMEVLCFNCRRSKDTAVQQSVTSFFKKKLPAKPEELRDAFGKGDVSVIVSSDEEPEVDAIADHSVCSRCRRPLQEKGGPAKPAGHDVLKGTGELPQLQRLRAYRRTAENQGIPFTISEKAASAMMRGNCVACGSPAPMRGHGLTRLRKWPTGMERPERGGFMGPYAEENLATACTMCNMFKSYRTVRSLVECCRHLATKNTPEEGFGEYPHRFRDNVSKRSRSCYISQSSTHTKTHAITNEEFNSIVAQRCFYCHKEPRKPKTLGPDDRGHFNGLDRLDSTNRVYTTETTVACCGDCNMMKYRWELEDFLSHCRKVARFNVGKQFCDEEVSDDDESELQGTDPTEANEQAGLEQLEVEHGGAES